jgi:membrane protease YdiL (CAAX protease family)
VARWVAFGALTLFVLAVLLLSARASQRVVADLAVDPARDTTDTPRGADIDTTDRPADHDLAAQSPEKSGHQPSTTALLANVALSHGFFAALLLGGLWLGNVPVWALGVGVGITGTDAVGVGIAIGVAIALTNTLLGGVLGTDPSARLRALLTPDSSPGWFLLLGVVLPIIAGFEELLFRAILIGAFSVGFGLPPWLLVVGSTIAFAAGHGAQGRLGIAVTGVLGLLLGAVFVLTGSLLVVIVAHYLVNAIEFVVLEGLGYEPFGS